jgi:hypothetical protein
VFGLSFKTAEAGRVALQTMQAFSLIRYTAFTVALEPVIHRPSLLEMALERRFKSDIAIASCCETDTRICIKHDTG